MAKKSQYFCVVTEGATTDGRTVTREWIQQMAETFNRKTYGARVWLEHLRGIMPDGPFKAYGDVLALEAREKDDGKLGLYAQIEPTDELIQMNKARQKMYTSIEVNPNFADSGKAYLVGLAVTDSPASLGTDMLQFTQQNPAGSALTERKQDKDNLFSASVEVELEFTDAEPESPSLSDRIKSFRQKFKKQVQKTDAQSAELLGAVEDLAEFAQDVSERQNEHQEASAAQAAEFSEQLAALKKSFDEFRQELENTDNSTQERPRALGGDGLALTDC